jgi:DNA-binding PadR family transcriptional regulator
MIANQGAHGMSEEPTGEELTGTALRAPDLPLTPAAFQILLALAGGERHGYGILREVAAHSAGQLRLGPGTLYRTLKHLLAAQLIAEVDQRVDPTLGTERRRYYQLTDLGRQAAEAEARQLARLVGHAREQGLLSGAAGAPTPATEVP